MNKELDIKFKNIPNQKWLPFIGDEYVDLNFNNKTLIVGESHYHDNTTESIAKHESASYTRLVVEEIAIGRCYWGTKIFPNFHKAMFENDTFDSGKFWNLCSFYNFIQRPMATNNGRPTEDDFLLGWSVFFDTIEILEPKTCIFIGVEASSTLRKAIKETEFKLIELVRDDMIGKAYPRRAKILDLKGEEVDVYFIRHSSQYFSWEKWNAYLKANLNHQLNWFEKRCHE